MPSWLRYLVVLLTLLVASAAAYAYYTHYQAESSLADGAQVRMTVSGFGDQLKQVPLLAPDDLVSKAMDMYYGLYVSPELLTTWKQDPQDAPGRLTSSPWPDRIEITAVTKNQDGTYTIDGNIVEVTSGDNGPQVADSYAVQFTLTKGPDGWQITGYAKL